MGKYKEAIHTVAHNFKNTTLTINGEHKVDGLDALAVERDEDEVSTMAAADGMASFVETSIQTGTITFSHLEASPTSDYMWDLYETGDTFKAAVVDSAAPTLDCSAAYCRVAKAPVVTRTREGQMVEWVLRTTYLKSRGGSYSLATP
jgi:hypothetical protein